VATFSRRKDDEAGEPREGAESPPDPRDDIDPLRLPEEEQVVYDLSGWPIAVHAEVAEALAGARVSHAWQGTDLVIHERHEAAADNVLADIEHQHGLEDTAAEREPIAREPGSEVEYDLADWESDTRALVTGRLIDADIPFRWEGGFLVVSGQDESLADSVLDGVEDSLGGGTAEDESGAEDGDSPMAQLFVAVDDLALHPNDRDAILRLNGLFERAEGEPVPFGLSSTSWDNILDQVSDLLDLALESDDAGEVKAEAIELRNALRPLV
jgi:hypothetical protein